MGIVQKIQRFSIYIFVQDKQLAPDIWKANELHLMEYAEEYKVLYKI